ncbi:MAG: signal peptide peptidase SppA [Bacteroidales bacterium]
MKGFFKFTFASILGVLIGLVIFILILAGIISASSKQKPVTVESNTVLFVKFDQPVIDRNPESPFEYFDPMTFEPQSRMGLDMILKNIEKAKENENIPGIVMDLNVVPMGMATLREIRDALIDFKSDGKFIYCFADNYSQGTYYMATVADKIYITPQGAFPFLGLSAEVLFFKDMLDKIGVEMQVFKFGEYKGAVEPFLYKKLSDENREQIQDYLNSLWSTMIQDISEARGIPVQELNDLADNLAVFSGEDALKYNLIDGLIYYDEFIDEIKALTDTPEDKNVKTITFAKLNKVPEKREIKGLAKDKIAVVYATGNIISGEAADGMIGGDKFARTIREARKDSSIKAIVLRVNSGGGDGMASDIIWREVKLAAETKPVIASMGDVAASGGYYIVAPATKILANPATITGSIGVFGFWPNVKSLMNDKLGITADVVKTNEHSDFGFPLEPLKEMEKQKLKEQVDGFYKDFVQIVAEGRDMSFEEVDELARGHVYTGTVAKAIGLIDDFGGLEDAIEMAAEEAGTETYRIVKLPKIQDPFQKIINDLTGNAKLKFLEEQLGENYYYYEQVQNINKMKGIQARMPFELRIK